MLKLLQKFGDTSKKPAPQAFYSVPRSDYELFRFSKTTDASRAEAAMKLIVKVSEDACKKKVAPEYIQEMYPYWDTVILAVKKGFRGDMADIGGFATYEERGDSIDIGVVCSHMHKGRFIIRHMMEHAHSRGFKEARLHAVPTAEKFWKDMGFKFIGRNKWGDAFMTRSLKTLR